MIYADCNRSREKARERLFSWGGTGRRGLWVRSNEQDGQKGACKSQSEHEAMAVVMVSMQEKERGKIINLHAMRMVDS